MSVVSEGVRSSVGPVNSGAVRKRIMATFDGAIDMASQDLEEGEYGPEEAGVFSQVWTDGTGFGEEVLGESDVDGDYVSPADGQVYAAEAGFDEQNVEQPSGGSGQLGLDTGFEDDFEVAAGDNVNNFRDEKPPGQSEPRRITEARRGYRGISGDHQARATAALVQDAQVAAVLAEEDAVLLEDEVATLRRRCAELREGKAAALSRVAGLRRDVHVAERRLEWALERRHVSLARSRAAGYDDAATCGACGASAPGAVGGDRAVGGGGSAGTMRGAAKSSATNASSSRNDRLTRTELRGLFCAHALEDGTGDCLPWAKLPAVLRDVFLAHGDTRGLFFAEDTQGGLFPQGLLPEGLLPEGQGDRSGGGHGASESAARERRMREQSIAQLEAAVLWEFRAAGRAAGVVLWDDFLSVYCRSLCGEEEGRSPTRSPGGRPFSAAGPSAGRSGGWEEGAGAPSEGKAVGRAARPTRPTSNGDFLQLAPFLGREWADRAQGAGDEVEPAYW